MNSYNDCSANKIEPVMTEDLKNNSPNEEEVKAPTDDSPVISKEKSNAKEASDSISNKGLTPQGLIELFEKSQQKEIQLNFGISEMTLPYLLLLCVTQISGIGKK